MYKEENEFKDIYNELIRLMNDVRTAIPMEYRNSFENLLLLTFSIQPKTEWLKYAVEIVEKFNRYYELMDFIEKPECFKKLDKMASFASFVTELWEDG